MINIALDGPAGSGKSTVAKAISKKLNILYLDTGAMYRAFALKVSRLGADCKNEEEVCKVVDQVDIKVKYVDGAQRTFLGDEDVSEKIRENHVSMMASAVSAHQCVREKLVELQREIAK
ncbi:MAG: cytidylate kinase, partial [Clostridiales bacterium]|nr:cytidylate kinase [Clostridiales bacterium]